MEITIIGTGYVGLVTGACFAEMGNIVTCVDIDQEKINHLNEGRIPIYEPGLEPIIQSCQKQNLLSFSTHLSKAIENAQILIIAVGTPAKEDGSADLAHVLAVAKSIGSELKQYTVIVNKSTVPVGTADKVHAAITEGLSKRGLDVTFDVVSNPEFLKEGAAIEDFMRPDRIIIGTDSARARQLMEELYEPFERTRKKMQFMGIRDAEMTKYVANAMLATKISFMNEVANLCEHLGVDVENVRKGIGSDKRIGYDFIYPGCGYGGSCFPKDVKALVGMAYAEHYEPWLLEAVEARNNAQKRRLFDKVQHHFGVQLKGLCVALWGLSFKPGTDDMREATSVVLIEALIKAGVTVRAYDPVAAEAASAMLPVDWIESGQLEIVRHQYSAIHEADALILVTEWKFFRQPDFDCLLREMKQPVIIDGRNQYDPDRLREKGFIYYGIGR